MSARVALAVSIPQTFQDRAVDVGAIRAYLARAEALGFHSAWVVEQVLGSIPSLEPVELLTYAAAVTERLRLGTAVLLTALRSPVHLAKSLATLDHLSGGRLDVGVGLGGNPNIYALRRHYTVADNKDGRERVMRGGLLQIMSSIRSLNASERISRRSRVGRDPVSIMGMEFGRVSCVVFGRPADLRRSVASMSAKTRGRRSREPQT
ncbi:MAG: LLM class flavin-dependent oxidoreductase, partial [candidate division NC10 bacterium]